MAVIVITVISVGGYLIYQKNIPSINTSNYKTYRNEKYGFEFQYPNYPPAKTSQEPDQSNTLWSVGITLSDNNGGYVMALLFGNVNDLKIKDSTKTTIGGKVAYVFTESGLGGSEHFYLIPLGNTYLTFFGASCTWEDPNLCDPDGSRFEKTFLSTFKFIKM